MNALLKQMSRWFGKTPVETGSSPLANSFNSQHSMLHDGSENATRAQLVQVLLRDLLRKNGMPPGCVQCQLHVVNSRARGEGVHVRLVVKDWDERLMKYSFAFQKALLTDIVQFEPAAANWLQGVSWQLEVAGSCPLVDLPGPQFWRSPGATGAFVAPSSAAKAVDAYDIVPLPAHAKAAAATAGKQAISGSSVTAVVATAAVATAVATQAPKVIAQTPSPNEELKSSQDETMQDLERLFAIRDSELAHLEADDMLPRGYDNTEPAPL